MRRTDGLAGGAAVAVAAWMTGEHLTQVMLGALAIAGILVLGVVLPAVWSSRPDRRRDARAVVRLILQALRQPRPR